MTLYLQGESQDTVDQLFNEIYTKVNTKKPVKEVIVAPLDTIQRCMNAVASMFMTFGYLSIDMEVKNKDNKTGTLFLEVSVNKK